MLRVIAYIIIVIGLILFPMPIPVGIFFIIGGVALLLSVDPSAQSHISKLRHQHPLLDSILYKATQKAPRFLRLALHKTRRKKANITRE